MKHLPVRAVLGFLVLSLVPGRSLAGGKVPVQNAWALVLTGPAEVYPKASPGKKVLARLNSGALVSAFETKRSGGRDWTEIRVMLPATLEVVNGWTETSRLEKLPVDRYPPDVELEKLLGGVYLEDFATRTVNLARFLVRAGRPEPLLVCYIGSIFLPQTRLQVFVLSNGNWTVGPYMEFLASQAQTGVTEVEVRDLVGDGNECLLLHEPFAQTFGASGVNLVIHRIGPNGFATLWRAPLEVRNLSSYPPKATLLDPPARNISAPGTVTRGSVEYQSRGGVSEPVWKGSVGFYVPGREEPVNTVTVEKACPWNGVEFAPLQ